MINIGYRLWETLDAMATPRFSVPLHCHSMDVGCPDVRLRCFPINEFGTSSRCPVCRDKTKVTRVKRERIDSVTTLQRCNSEDIVSKSTKDGRIEQCSKCGNEWGHDVIFTLNMLHIAQRMP
jgi:hypothetical protein